MSNTYIVEGRYHGKVRMYVRAKSYAEAVAAFEDANEDDSEILEPSKIEPDFTTMKESK